MLADLTDVAPIAVAVEGCARLHREVTDALIAAAVDAGRAGDVVGLATAAHAADPLREPAVLLLMRVLAATGQAPEALRIGREYRRRLAEETGLDPSPALGEIERDVAGAGAAAPVEPIRPTTRLFGRDEQVGALHRLLATERLVTVVGPGGVGKTRLALEVARRSEATTVLLLAPVTDRAAIPHALAAALNLQVVQGDVLAACVALLGDRPGLLVVDNCEHLLDAARDVVGALLSACPRLSVLATSREPLGLSVEHAYRLAPLALPRPGQDPSQAAAVAVFLDRARRVRPGAAPTPADLELVADVVRHLDGMPLAIELAAGRLSTFSLADLHRRLDRALDLLGGRPSGEARHRTLRATVEWSYQLLGDDERRLFRYLSVFVDGIALDAAEDLAVGLRLAGDPGTVLSRLVDASMLDAEFTDGGTRYRMLETLRAFGLDRLAAEGEDGDAGDRLLGWAVELTAWIGATLLTEHEPEADAVLRREMANLRAALATGPRPRRRRRRRRRRGRPARGRHVPRPHRDPGAGPRSWPRTSPTTRRSRGTPLRPPCWVRPGKRPTTAVITPRPSAWPALGLSRATDAFGTWRCLSVLAVVALAGGAYAESVGRCLAAVGNGVRVDEALGLAALATAYDGDLDRARELHARGRAGGRSPSMQAWSDYVAGEIESLAGNAEQAERHYLRAIDLARGTGATFLAGVATRGPGRPARQHGPGRGCAAWIWGRHRLLRAHRQLAPPVAGIAQSRGAAAPDRGSRPRGRARRRR